MSDTELTDNKVEDVGPKIPENAGHYQKTGGRKFTLTIASLIVLLSANIINTISLAIFNKGLDLNVLTAGVLGILSVYTGKNVVQKIKKG